MKLYLNIFCAFQTKLQISRAKVTCAQ